jgi:hypothetical protein
MEKLAGTAQAASWGSAIVDGSLCEQWQLSRTHEENATKREQAAREKLIEVDRKIDEIVDREDDLEQSKNG